MNPQEPVQPNQNVTPSPIPQQPDQFTSPTPTPQPPQPTVIQPEQPGVIQPQPPVSPAPTPQVIDNQVPPIAPVVSPQSSPVVTSGIVSGSGFAGPINQVSPTAPGAASSGEKSFMVTFLLSLFLGGIGADRFYLGKIGTGLLKLFTFGGFLIWATIDMIMILAGKMRDKEGKTLSGYEQNRKLAFIICGVILTINLISTVTVTYMITKTTKDVIKTVSDTTKEASKDCPNGTCAADSSTIKFKEIAYKESFKVGIIAAEVDPAIVGDAADSGKQYVAVKFDVTNEQSKELTLPGTFYYKTADGKLFNDVTTMIDGPTASAKDAQLKESYISLASDNTFGANSADFSHYLLFQVPKGDLGQLVWFKEPMDTTSEQLAIFDLK